LNRCAMTPRHVVVRASSDLGVDCASFDLGEDDTCSDLVVVCASSLHQRTRRVYTRAPPPTHFHDTQTRTRTNIHTRKHLTSSRLSASLQHALRSSCSEACYSTTTSPHTPACSHLSSILNTETSTTSPLPPLLSTTFQLSCHCHSSRSRMSRSL